MFDTDLVGVRKREYVPKHYAADGVRRHVWIYGKDPTARYPWPGLLVEWHRREDEWWARVLFVRYPSVPGEFVSEWIPASALRVAQEPYRRTGYPQPSSRRLPRASHEPRTKE